MCLNSYKTKWVIVKTNNPISASQKKQLQQINSTCLVTGNDVVSIHSLGKNISELQEQLSVILNKNGGYSVVITDRQYGLINNNWAKNDFPSLAKPFTYAIYAQELNMKKTIPVSAAQFKNRKQF
jgi:hypothetical protein